MNIQFIGSPDETILWISGALPGKTHVLSAARIWGILRELENAGIITLADKAYQGAESRSSPRTRARTSPNPRNEPTAPLHGPGEHANAQLKSWKILRKAAL
ncbi:transposase family protein [Sphaerisporangium viridialbum]|uniref:transposase family protein n=1 Tax=Sphaerisporangium viridialbum TaxID=46189 RepID=UPI003C72B809